METVDLKKELVTTESPVRRELIMDLESMIKKSDDVILGDSELCPLKHSFSDGIYVREITIPQGTLLTGKIHKHEHPNFLLKGEVIVVTEEGREILKAPCSMMSKAGTKRALYAVTELVWTTIHHNPTNTQDLKELEKIVIADSYYDYEKFISTKDNLLNKTKRLLIKTLSK